MLYPIFISIAQYQQFMLRVVFASKYSPNNILELLVILTDDDVIVNIYMMCLIEKDYILGLCKELYVNIM